MASALEHAHIHSTVQDATVSPHGAAAVEHLQLAPPQGGSVRSLGSGGYAGSNFFVRYYVDDDILVEV